MTASVQAEQMAQLLRPLSHRCKDRSQSPRTHINSQARRHTSGTLKPANQAREAKFQANEKLLQTISGRPLMITLPPPCTRRNKLMCMHAEDYIWACVLSSMHTLMCMHAEDYTWSCVLTSCTRRNTLMCMHAGDNTWACIVTSMHTCSTHAENYTCACVLASMYNASPRSYPV